MTAPHCRLTDLSLTTEVRLSVHSLLHLLHEEVRFPGIEEGLPEIVELEAMPSSQEQRSPQKLQLRPSILGTFTIKLLPL
jgi:hypothetical protein